ncbi:MAG: diphthine synthase [archaeon]
MLYLIGIGLKPEHLTLEALNAIKKCKKIYLEAYTSKYAEGSVKELEKIIGAKLVELGRKAVEEGFESALTEAKKEDIALLIYGNVFSATTHVQLLLDAKEKNIIVETIPGISIFSFLGKTGLSEYKFGRTVSIVFWQENYKPESFYDKILDNYSNSMHTLCLLDIKKEAKEERLMKPKEALEILQGIAKERSGHIFDNTLIGIISKAGAEDEKIVFGKIQDLIKMEFDTPACLIVCAQLDEKEKEALELWKKYSG